MFKTFGNWLSFPKKVVSTDQLKTRIKSEQNNFGTIFCLQFIRDVVVKHLPVRKRLLKVSFPLGLGDVTTVLERYRSTFKSSLEAF